MNRSRVLAIFLCAAVAALAHADDKKTPKPNSMSVAVRTVLKGELRQTQVPQYGLASELTRWGFAVESRVPTAWDKHLATAKVTVIAPPAPPKAGEAAPEPKKPDTAFVIEGTIELIYNPTKFYENDRELTINYVAKVGVVVRDSSGKELKKIAWQNYWGTNNDAGHDKVIAESETRATRFLLHDILAIPEVQKAVDPASQEKLKAFLADEEEYRKKEFDDFESEAHKGKGEPKADEKKE